MRIISAITLMESLPARCLLYRGDNQGIIGLEVVYEEILKGEPGTILTVTDCKGYRGGNLGRAAH